MTRILVAEDDALTRDLIRYSLEQVGFDIITATNGREALQHIIMRPPDLVLLDIFMPGISGLEVIEHVRDHDDFRSVRIIAITGSVIAERNPLLAQVDLILRKPFPIEHLLTAISQVMQAPV